jgi:rhodanese-related sulfurtransferase
VQYRRSEEEQMHVTTISPQRLQELVQSGTSIQLLDVRTPIEYREVHVPFARNVPLDQLQPKDWQPTASAGANPLYVICRSGSRGRQACEKLLAAGITQVVNVEGGTLAWEQAGLPVQRGKKTMSLERQVRIAAGSLVVIGSVLALTVNPYWVGLAAFVGAGLVFAGVTDTCGMGLLLAKMPWNQVPRGPVVAGGGPTCAVSSTGA